MSARTTRILAFAGGTAALAGAIVLALVAVDAQAWSDTVRNDDALFRVSPAQATWTSPQYAPFGLSERLLGVRDDVALRRAIASFQIARLQSTAFANDPSLQAAKARAQIALVAVERSAPHDRDRSIAANLLGVLAFQEARNDPSSAASAISRAALAFRRAILWDNGNEDAKANLELVLRLTQAAQQARRDQPGVLGNAHGHGTGAGRGGSGY